jgi:2-polyprenyl-3-methyl-5-hydroxy-6-metoxy-1,4-benzoquinol methylase
MAKTGNKLMANCPVCEASAETLYFLNSPYVEQPERYAIRKCTACGHGFAEGRVDAEFLAHVYAQDFHASVQQTAPVSSDGQLPEEPDRYPIIANSRQRVHWLAGLGYRGRLCDIGAGRGYFLLCARDRFAVSGVELSDEAAVYARQTGLDVISGDFLTTNAADRRFDVITMWDVLAGFPDIKAALNHIERQIADGGVFVATVPMRDSRIARMTGRFWPFWIPPVNLHYFSVTSLARALHDAGLEIVALEYMGKKVALSFIWLKLLRSLGLAATSLRHWIRSPRPLTLNLHDVVTVIARRRSSLK